MEGTRQRTETVSDMIQVAEDHQGYTDVWMKDATECWRKVIVVKNVPEGVVVLNRQGTEVTLANGEFHPFDPSHSLDLDDISRLNNLHEAPLLHVLKRRFQSDKIYTFCGHVLLSVNPYKMFPNLYDLEDLLASSWKKEGPESYPHVYSIARITHEAMVSDKKEGEAKVNQSIIVSGESGAGKTEASKHVMRYLLRTSSSTDKTKGGEIQAKLMQSNVVLESFGNAKTLRNDNSSRFGKYIRLKYDDSDHVIGAKTEHFLLEKSRLVHVEEGERNYHSFYQLCAGLDEKLKEELGLRQAADYVMLSQGNVLEVSDGVDDAKEFEETVKALATLKFSEEEQNSVFKLLAGLLHLGNSSAAHPDGDEYQQVEIKNSDEAINLSIIASLFGVDPTLLKNTVCIRMQTSGRGSTTAIPLNPEQTMNNIHALIKYTYGSLFKNLVRKINDAHEASSDLKSSSFIGILDIFGFEIMQLNSFEQLCINFANEMLQRQFNQQVFVLEKERYAEEGLEVNVIEFQDNQLVIDLISKKPEGLFILLEEHGMMGRKPDNGALLNVIHNKHGDNKHPNYSKPRFGGDEFVVKHFAGDVTYNIKGFIEKNNDSLNEQLLRLMAGSSSEFLQRIYKTEEPAGGQDLPNPPPGRMRSGSRMSKMAQRNTVSSTFRVQLESLVATLGSTEPHYIKCIKPNAVKLPGGMSNKMVVEQLRYSGVLEVVRIRRQGYPVRLKFDKFAKQFEILLRGKGEVYMNEERWKEGCTYIVEKWLEEGQYQMGTTKIFLRDGVLEELNFAVKEFYADMAARIQSRFRGNNEKAIYSATRSRLVMLQKFSRMAVKRREFKEKQEKVAAMQRAMRGRIGRKKFMFRKEVVLEERKREAGALKLQALTRGRKGRHEVKVAKSAIAVQAIVRRLVEKKRLDKKKKANLFLQGKARQLNAKHVTGELRREKKEKEGAVLIGKRVRMVRAKKELEKRKQEKKEDEAGVKIGSAWRMKKEAKEYKKILKAVVGIQCGARVMKARGVMFSEKTKARLKREAEERKAASRMQGGWRMVKAKEERKRRKEDRDFKKAVVSLQCGLRIRVAGRFVQEKRGEKKFKNAVVALQCKRRVKKAEMELKGRKEVRNEKCAVAMQRMARGRTERLEFEKVKGGVLVVQKNARMAAERRKFGERKEGYVKLQAKFRAFKGKMEYEKDLSGVTVVQSVFRKKAEAGRYQRTLVVIRGLQRAVKVFLKARAMQVLILKAHKSAKKGKVDELVALMGESSSYGDIKVVRNRYDRGKTLLHSAVMSNSVECCALLCSESDDVFVKDYDGNTCFHIAAKHCSFAVMKFFADVALNGIYKEEGGDRMNGRVGKKIVRSSKLIKGKSSGSVGSMGGGRGGEWREYPVIKEGILKKRKEWRGWDKRHVVLRKNIIEVFKRVGDAIPVREISMTQCIVKRGEKAGKYTFELFSPLLLDKKNKEGKMYFGAESEKDLQLWLVALRQCHSQTEDLRESRSGARSLLDLEKRSELCALKNVREETALHLLCEFAFNVGGGGSLAVEIALWLAENGPNWLNSKNVDGNTPLHLAIIYRYVDLAAALVRKGADMSVKNQQGKTAMDLIENPKDVESICMVANIGASARKPLLGPPQKVRGCTYLTILMEKITLTGAASLECPFVRVNIYNNERQHMEEVQEISKYCHRSETCLWYTTQFHMQIMLENCKECFVLFELCNEGSKRGKIVTETLAWTFLRLNDGNIDTGGHTLEALQPPVVLTLGENAKKEADELAPAANGAFFSIDTYLTMKT